MSNSLKPLKLPKVISIVGPTASGKSDLAIELALQFNGEVVSADSRQVYRGLDIISGKVTESEMRGVPHHLLDVASPMEIFDITQFKKQADLAVKKILSRGKLPILCGGTGYYIEAVVKNITLPEVPANEELRARLERLPANELFAMLQQADPSRAKTIDPKNPRRLIRALEIIDSFGKIPARTSDPRYRTLTIGIETEPVELRARINARLEARVDAGMTLEAKLLHDQGLSYQRMESLGLECRYLARYHQNTITLEQMITQLQFEIWHYAKRQIMWFKRDKNVKWFQLNKRPEIETTVNNFLKLD